MKKLKSEHYQRVEKLSELQELTPPPIPLYPIAETRRRRALEILDAAFRTIAALGVDTDVGYGGTHLRLPAGSVPVVDVPHALAVTHEDLAETLLHDSVKHITALRHCTTRLLVDSGIPDELVQKASDRHHLARAKGHQTDPPDIPRIVSG